MDQSNEHFYHNVPTKLPTTTPAEQFKRQRISVDWQPNGFERYAYQKALDESMPVIGGPADMFGPNPDRYELVDEKMEVEFPVRKAGRQGK